MKNKVTYHSAITGKFVSKKYAEDNPDNTVKVTSCKFTDLEYVLNDILNKVLISDRIKGIPNSNNISDYVTEYMNRK